MSSFDVEAWLGSLGLGQYAAAFRRNDVDRDVLGSLTSDDLKELGVESLGHRKKILAAALLAGNEPPGAPAAVAGPPLREGERRQVTILFADVSGYTALSRELDPEELHRLLARYLAVVDGIVIRRGGSVDKHIGDAVMALFGAPVAHGDDPLRAAMAAIDVHAAMETLSGELGRRLAVHIGIAAGEVIAAPLARGEGRDYTVLGDAVNLAARLDALAQGGETLVSESVARALEGMATLEPLGERVVKGFAEPVRVHRLLDARSESARRTPFVGRGAEMATIASLIERVQRGGGTRLLVRGEAGVGKSRLAEEALGAARSLGLGVHRALVLDFGVGAGEDATAALVRSFLGLPEAGSGIPSSGEIADAARASGLAGHLGALLHDVLGAAIPPELRGELDARDAARTAALLRELVLHAALQAARARPSVVLVEDVHWADARTLLALEALTDASCAAPLLLLATTRPEVGLASRALEGSELVDLGPLPAADALELARASGDDPATLEAIVARSGGNPLFLEQLVKSAHEGAAALPASIHSLVLARLDRLRGRDREALQVASVLGQRIDLPALRALLRDPAYDAAELLDRALLRRDGSVLLFGHALVQEGVYASLLHARRRELHHRAAEHYAATDPTLRARHLDRAEDPGAAAAYLAAARQHAAAFHADEAIALCARGAELPAGPATAALRLLQGMLLVDLGRVPEAVVAFRGALAVTSDPVEACRARTGIADGHRIADRYAEALEELALAEEGARDAGLRARIHAIRGMVYFPQGRIEACLGEQRAAVLEAERSGDPEMIAVSLSCLGDAEYARGHMRTAAELFGRCVAHAEAHGLRRHVPVNRVMAIASRMCELDLEGSLEELERAAVAAARLGQLRAETLAHAVRLLILGEVEADVDARALAAHAEEVARRLGSPRFLCEVIGADARVLVREGELGRARERLDEALGIARVADGMAFFGPTLLGSAARLARSDDERAAALQEGEEILARGSLAPNHLTFRRDALQASFEAGDLAGVEHQVRALAAHAPGADSTWVDVWCAWGRVAVARARGQESSVREERDRLVERLERIGIRSALPALVG